MKGYGEFYLGGNVYIFISIVLGDRFMLKTEQINETQPSREAEKVWLCDSPTAQVCSSCIHLQFQSAALGEKNSLNWVT